MSVPSLFEPVSLRLGPVIALSVTIVLALVALTLFWAHARAEARGRRGAADDYVVIAWCVAVFAALALITTALMTIPWRAEYLRLYRVETTVLSVSNVLTESSGDLTRQPIVELDGIDRPVVIDDPRIVRLEGADLTLTCTISWHYQAADTYTCSIYSLDGGETR